MKKTSQIFYLVGAIVAIVVAVSSLGSGIADITSGIMGLVNRDYITGIVAKILGMTPDEVATASEAAIIAVCVGRIVSGAFELLRIPFCILASIFSFKARKQDTKTNAIIVIVFSAISLTFVSIPGAILNLIYLKRQQESKVVDAEFEEKKQD